MTPHGRREPFLPKVMELCAKHAPGFHWDIVELKAQDYGLPQPDAISFLRCMKKNHAGAMPNVLPPSCCGRLYDFLDPAEGNINRKDILSRYMRDNLLDYERHIKSLVREDPQMRSTTMVAAVNLDRKSMMLGKDGTLRSSLDHKHVFLLSTDDLHLPGPQRRVFRFISDAERLALKGVNPGYLAKYLPSDSLRHAACSCVPSTVYGAAAMPLINAVAASKKLCA
eukprot:7014410-Pyramimonas_sp.AAC.1